MYNEQLRALIDAQKQLDSERERLERQLATIKSTIASLGKLVANLQQLQAVKSEDGRIENAESGLDTASITVGSEPDEPHRNPRKEEVAAASRKIIEGAGHPLNRGELFQLLEQQGFRIKGANPHMVLSTMLWRAGSQHGIVRLNEGGRGYWLKEKPWPEANYQPESSPDDLF